MPAYLCSAYLRVYCPMPAFDEDTRTAIQHAICGEVPGALRSRLRDAATGVALVPPGERRDVYTRTVDGETYVCPAFPALRALEALASVRETAPAARRLFSAEEIEGARIELRRLRKTFPGLRPSVLQSLWHVPRRWFLCFQDTDRRIEHLEEHPGLRYETSIPLALERLDRALRVLDRGIQHPAMIAGTVLDLAHWLRSVPTDGIVELDYASVGSLFDGDDLADDHSAADMWSRIDALGAGDGARAASFQRRLEARWAQRRHLELTN